MISILYGLSSAVSWGAADFVGGIGTRRIGAYRAVFFQEVVGLALLVPVVMAVGEPVPPIRTFIFAILAGLLGNIGLLLLYYSLATGQMSIAAPVSALMTAILPVVVGSFTEGFPGPLIFVGFAFALAGVWFVSQNEDRTRDILSHLSDVRLPLLAGVGFGLFFILMHSAAQGSTIWPMVISRSTGLLVVGLSIALRREGWAVQRGVWGILVLNGVLDIGGNAFFIVAGHTGRLDISAVLGALYPGATVLLAWFILKERLSRTQWMGVLAALIAILLFTL